MAGIAIGVLTLFCILLGAFVYFLPTIVASNRKHRQATAIGALNLLLGWTILGWVVALVWALMSQESANAASAAGSGQQRACPACGLVASTTAQFCAGCGKALAG